VLAQPATPPPPKEYQVQLRYRIASTRNARLAQFFALTRYLESIGFKKDPGPDTEAEDPEQTRMTGTITSAKVRKILADPHVKSLLLIPAGYKLPVEPDKPVKVELELASQLVPERRRQLADQVRPFLEELGFEEAVGYDHRQHTRLKGTIPAGNLDLLLQDLRWQSGGWLAPRVPVAELPAPVADAWPLVVTEVIPEPAGVAEAKAPPSVAPVPEGEQHLLKIARDLREMPPQESPVRIQVFLASAPGEVSRAWRRELTLAAPDATIEGRLGPLVTLKTRMDQIPALATLANVVSIRLPRPAPMQIMPARPPKLTPEEVLRASGVDRLHAQGRRGQGVRVAVIDGDFRGYRQFLGKQLPANTHEIDLTAECDPNIEPKKFLAEDSVIGRGTQCALALALAAPQVDLTLIRIDPETLFQLQEVARYINGERFRSDSLELRREELSGDRDRLEREREQLLAERKLVLDNFGQGKAAVERRQAYFKKQAEFDQREEDITRREERYLKLVGDLRGLKGIGIVACALVWNEGYPVDGSNPLSRYFDEGSFCSATWFQAAGDDHGQVWAGTFRDEDGNRVMEFAAPGERLPPDRWTSELNFLGWRQFSGPVVPEVPKAKLRVAVQWREPHDPTLSREGEDVYRAPLADLRLLILRQRDPTGTKLPADDMEMVARSVYLPLRIDHHPETAMYEQTVEFTIDLPGRYALRVEGQVPKSIQPASVPVLPASQKLWELAPRISISTLSGDGGQAIFLDYASELGSIGTPADAHLVTSVGATDVLGQPQPYSSRGPVLYQELNRKPGLFALDQLPLGIDPERMAAGSGIATGFAAGRAACVK
jgi:hypothetical protein